MLASGFKHRPASHHVLRPSGVGALAPPARRRTNYLRRTGEKTWPYASPIPGERQHRRWRRDHPQR